MATDLHASHPLPCDVTTAYAALTDESWPQTKDAALSDGSRLESREPTADGGVVVRSSRGLPSGLPGFLDKLVPAGGRAVQVDTWGPVGPDGASGTWRVEVPGAPAEIGGRVRLVPTATGCDYVITGTAKVKIPLVGGKAEKFVAETTQQTAAAEAEVLRGVVSA